MEQRRREKAKQYFDELRGLLPYGGAPRAEPPYQLDTTRPSASTNRTRRCAAGDSAKFDKNAILHHSIALIKQLLADLDQEEMASGVNHQEQQARQLPNMAEFRVCFDVTRQPLCFAGLDSRVWEPPPPPPRTKWTRCALHPVLIGHAASLGRSGRRTRRSARSWATRASRSAGSRC